MELKMEEILNATRRDLHCVFCESCGGNYTTYLGNSTQASVMNAKEILGPVCSSPSRTLQVQETSAEVLMSNTGEVNSDNVRSPQNLRSNLAGSTSLQIAPS